ncbi:Multidrug resistance-associated protein 1, partial [Modicella reniformis]
MVGSLWPESAKRIHAKLLTKVFRLSIAFFNTTPPGRIINRFSSDMLAVDIRIPTKVMDLLLFGISVSSTLILVAFTIFVIPFLILAYWVVFKSFMNVSKTLVRLYATTKSPIYQHFNETLGDVSMIRAFRIESQFVEANDGLSDRATNN